MELKTKACLFGGALLTAGMAADAQPEFIIQANDITGAYPTFALSDAYNYANPYGYDTAYAPDLNTTETETDAGGFFGSFGTSTASTIQTSNLLRAEASWQGDGLAGYGFAEALFQVFFQVSEDAELVVSWDVEDTDGFASAVVLDENAGAELFSFDGLADGAPLSGSATIALEAGTDYAYIGGLTNSGFGPFLFNTETQFVQAELIPTPGTLGLLGIAGVAAARRRRA